jgi:hypothetical protein
MAGDVAFAEGDTRSSQQGSARTGLKGSRNQIQGLPVVELMATNMVTVSSMMAALSLAVAR